MWNIFEEIKTMSLAERIITLVGVFKGSSEVTNFKKLAFSTNFNWVFWSYVLIFAIIILISKTRKGD